MKLAERAALFPALAKDWQFVRFATLTRPFLGSRELPLSIGRNEAIHSDAFLRRVQNCYRRASELGSQAEATIWADLEQENGPFLSALLDDDLESLRRISANLYGGPTIQGMAHVQAFVTGRKTIYPRKYFSYRIKDSLFSLTEALGISPLPSNQQTTFRAYVKYLNQELKPLVHEAEAALGHEISVPLVGCPPVADIGGRFFNPDLIRHAYVPHRIEQLGINNEDGILEIGGGYGCVARYALIRGYKRWTIIDLPYVNAIQMIWLGATLGEEAVSGLGEQRAAIHLLPSNAKHLIAEEDYALALNMDSLPEMPAGEADDYLSIIESGAELFFSVNQEAQKVHRGSVAQNSVHDMMSSRKMKLIQRSPYWMEQGYTEEIYRRTH